MYQSRLSADELAHEEEEDEEEEDRPMFDPRNVPVQSQFLARDGPLSMNVAGYFDPVLKHQPPHETLQNHPNSQLQSLGTPSQHPQQPQTSQPQPQQGFPQNNNVLIFPPLQQQQQQQQSQPYMGTFSSQENMLPQFPPDQRSVEQLLGVDYASLLSRDKESKDKHKESESRRRMRIRDSFNELRVVSECTRKDRTSILLSAIEHLHMCKHRIADLEGKLQESSAKVTQQATGGGGKNPLTDQQSWPALLHHPVFEHLPCALVALDGRFLQANDALASFLGLSRGKLEHNSLLTMTHPADLATTFASFQELLSGNRTTWETTLRIILGSEVKSFRITFVLVKQHNLPAYYLLVFAHAQQETGRPQ